MSREDEPAMPEAKSADQQGSDIATAGIRPSPADGTRGAESRAERVAIITGTRLCIRCGFNLTGQTILREPAYDLLIARCPECGTVAPLQEYPPLGAWQRRWAVLLAVLWFVTVSVLSLLTAAMPMSLAGTIAYRQSTPLSAHIGSQWGPVIMSAMKAVRDKDPAADSLPLGISTLAQQYISWYASGYTDEQIEQWAVSGSIPLDESWWKDNKAAVMQSAPGVSFGWIRKEPLFAWVMRGVLYAAVGCAWSAILLHLRRRGRLVFYVVLGVLAVLGAWSGHPSAFGTSVINLGWNPYYYGQANAWTIAYEHVWFEAARAAVVNGGAPVLGGVRSGRPAVGSDASPRPWCAPWCR